MFTSQRLHQAQVKQKGLYDRTAKPWTFQVGDRVLVCSSLFPWNTSGKWEDPFPSLKVQGTLTYEVHCGTWKRDTKVLHVNYLKRWYNPKADIPMVAWVEKQPPPLSSGNLSWMATPGE